MIYKLSDSSYIIIQSGASFSRTEKRNTFIIAILMTYYG